MFGMLRVLFSYVLLEVMIASVVKYWVINTVVDVALHDTYNYVIFANFCFTVFIVARL